MRTGRRGVRRAVVGVLVAVAGLISASAAAADQAPLADRHHSDQAAFDRLRQLQEDAWARGDGAAWAATFTKDGDMVTFNGDHSSGRERIAGRMQHYFDTYLQGTRLHMLTEQVRYVEPDTVVIVRTGCVLWHDETACTDDALSVNTNVLVERHGRWLQTSFQNTRVRPIP
jgi:uncharacterized protein (TIGR02246 family)